MILLLSALRKYVADATGIFSSTICFVHCIASPFLLSIGMGLGELLWLKYLFIGMAFLSITFAVKETTTFKVAAFLWVSFWVFTLSLLFENRWEVLEYTGLLASIGIITGHLTNIRSCSKCVQNQSDDSTLTTIKSPLTKSNQEDEVIY